MPHYATLVPHSAKLSEKFGYDYAVWLFGQDAIDSLPVLERGANKGKPKGYVVWRKAVVAGWSREVSRPLAVGNIADAWIGAGQFSTRDTSLRGRWFGSIQNLAGTYELMGPQAREAEAARRAKDEAERWESFRDMIRKELGPDASDAEVDRVLAQEKAASAARVAKLMAEAA